MNTKTKLLYTSELYELRQKLSWLFKEMSNVSNSKLKEELKIGEQDVTFIGKGLQTIIKLEKAVESSTST